MPQMRLVVSRCQTPILDLGAGVGIDTLHLNQLGHLVIACDFSEVALEKIRQNIPEVQTRRVDMEQPLPFENEMFDFIVANKSLHYFSVQKTRALFDEVYRVLKMNGHFAFVVNSTKDENFGAGQGIKLEDNFYEVRGITKRFFDLTALERFFEKNKWDFVFKQEGDTESARTEAVSLKGMADKKLTWTCLVRKKG